jgi:hypothetical protein
MLSMPVPVVAVQRGNYLTHNAILLAYGVLQVMSFFARKLCDKRTGLAMHLSGFLAAMVSCIYSTVKLLYWFLGISPGLSCTSVKVCALNHTICSKHHMQTILTNALYSVAHSILQMLCTDTSHDRFCARVYCHAACCLTTDIGCVLDQRIVKHSVRSPVLESKCYQLCEQSTEVALCSCDCDSSHPDPLGHNDWSHSKLAAELRNAIYTH